MADSGGSKEQQGSWKGAHKDHRTAEAELIKSFKEPIVDVEQALDIEREKQKNTYVVIQDDNKRIIAERKRVEQEMEEEIENIKRLREKIVKAKEKSREKDVKISELEGEIRTLSVMKKVKRKERMLEGDPRAKVLAERVRVASVESAGKDREIVAVKKELEETQALAQALQQVVDKQRLAQVRAGERGAGGEARVSYVTPSNVVTKR